MPKLLHILTDTEDPLATDLIARQKARSEYQVEVFDMSVEQPDYKSLLEKIFTADSVQVW